jgi:hypothetical protein
MYVHLYVYLFASLGRIYKFDMTIAKILILEQIKVFDEDKKVFLWETFFCQFSESFFSVIVLIGFVSFLIESASRHNLFKII